MTGDNGNMGRSCATCRFWAPISEQCRKNPPAVQFVLWREQMSSYTAWPETEQNDWCGSFEPWVPEREMLSGVGDHK